MVNGLLIYHTNPNEMTGGKGCLYVGERGSADCCGPYFRLQGRVFSPISPLPVVCAHHLHEMTKDVQRECIHTVPGSTGTPPEPPAPYEPVVAQRESGSLSQDELAEIIAPKKRPRRRRADEELTI